MTHRIDDEPLGLAVHSLPSLEDASSEKETIHGRWKLLAIVFICSLPVIAAYFAYFVVRPQGKAAFGELIQPVRPVDELRATTMDGASFPLAKLKGQWLLVSVVPSHCDQDCKDRLFLHHQLRETLNKDKDRVDWIVLLAADTTAALSPGRFAENATVLRGTSEVFNQWLPSAPDGRSDSYLYVVDPLGNTMMRFPSRFAGDGAAKAKKDLDRLLRASLNWDPPGR